MVYLRRVGRGVGLLRFGRRVGLPGVTEGENVGDKVGCMVGSYGLGHLSR